MKIGWELMLQQQHLAFYPTTGQTFSRTLSKNVKLSVSDVAKNHAVLSHSFCKVLGPRLHKLLILNGTEMTYFFENSHGNFVFYFSPGNSIQN